MRLPGNTRPGSWRWPVEPCVRVVIELPCVSRLEEKWWRLMTPAKPLPMVVPCTSTVCPTLKISTPILPPTFSSASSLASARNSLQRVARFHRRLGEVPGEGLLHAARAALAERDLHGRIAVLVRGLDLRDPVVGHVEHGHRLGVALVGEDAHHADLAADQSYRHDYFSIFYV